MRSVWKKFYSMLESGIFLLFRGKKLGIVNDGACMFMIVLSIYYFVFFTLFLYEIGWIKKISCMCGWKIAIEARRNEKQATKIETIGWEMSITWMKNSWELRASESLWTTTANNREKIWEKMHLWWQAMMEICGKNAKLFREQHFSFGISLIILVSTRSYENIFRCHIRFAPLKAYAYAIAMCMRRSVGADVGM